MRRFASNNLVRPLFVVSLAVLLLAGLLPALAQSPGYDLFQTGSGSAVSLPGIGSVPLQGVAIQGSTGNTDTMIHRTQSVPPGGGTVSVTVFALFMKSSSPVTFNGQSADVYVTINNTGGVISSSVIPQPDSLAGSNGTVTVRPDGTFDSSITVNADVIFVKAGTSVSNPADWLAHQPAPPVTLTSTNSTWSTSPPAGYPGPSGFPSGGFYPIKINGHLVPPHLHAIVPAQCVGVGIGAHSGNQAVAPVKACVVALQ
jgi:hypothetical protein